MYLTVRKFSNVKSHDEVIKKVKGGLLSTLSNYPGFINYYATRFEDGDLGAVSMFATKVEADKAADAVTRWIEKNLSKELPAAPLVMRGEVIFNAASRSVGAPA